MVIGNIFCTGMLFTQGRSKNVKQMAMLTVVWPTAANFHVVVAKN
jgi:hypothetical protein